MIKLIKGFRYNATGFKDDCGKYITFLMNFRDKKFEILNLIKTDAKPYLGATLGLKDAEKLRDWLNQVIAIESKYCDACYNFKLPNNLSIQGDLHCKNCNAILFKKDVEC